MNDKTEKYLESRHRKVQKALEYEAFLKTEIGKELIQFINDQYLTVQNEIVLEEHQRVSKSGTDTLRGRMQQLTYIHGYFNAVIRDGISANQEIVKLNQIT